MERRKSVLSVEECRKMLKKMLRNYWKMLRKEPGNVEKRTWEC